MSLEKVATWAMFCDECGGECGGLETRKETLAEAKRLHWRALSKSEWRCPTCRVKANERLRIKGVCRKCGCTFDNPCEQGCGWADESMTLCTACS
jgi:hypothetical protein